MQKGEHRGDSILDRFGLLGRLHADRVGVKQVEGPSLAMRPGLGQRGAYQGVSLTGAARGRMIRADFVQS
jgi:hypothetical protein